MLPWLLRAGIALVGAVATSAITAKFVQDGIEDNVGEALKEAKDVSSAVLFNAAISATAVGFSAATLIAISKKLKLGGA